LPQRFLATEKKRKYDNIYHTCDWVCDSGRLDGDDDTAAAVGDRAGDYQRDTNDNNVSVAIASGGGV
jgi:hypothetical protein